MTTSNRLIILMVILATLLLSLSYVGSTMENTKERANLAADEVELKSMQDSKATTKSWTRWAKEKLAGFGIGKDKAEEAAGDIATTTQKKASDIASAAEKAEEVKEGMKGNAVPDPESIAAAADKAWEMKEMVMDTAANVKESASDKATMANVEDAERAYENAKLKAAEAYKTARDAMSHGAKETYEAAKERVSEAVGNVGAQYKNYEAGEL